MLGCLQLAGPSWFISPNKQKLHSLFHFIYYYFICYFLFVYDFHSKLRPNNPLKFILQSSEVPQNLNRYCILRWFITFHTVHDA